jgi:hypothetical protein
MQSTRFGAKIPKGNEMLTTSSFYTVRSERRLCLHCFLNTKMPVNITFEYKYLWLSVNQELFLEPLNNVKQRNLREGYELLSSTFKLVYKHL